MFNECLEIRRKNCSFLHPWFLLLKPFCLRSNIKYSTQCFITRWNTLKFVKNTPLRLVFSTLFSVFHLVMKRCVSCLIYFFLTFDFVYEAPHSKPNLTVLSFVAIKQYLSVIVCYMYASHSGPLSFKLFVSPLTGTLKWATRAPKMLLSCFLFLILLEMLAKQLLLESVVQSLVFNLMIFTR